MLMEKDIFFSVREVTKCITQAQKRIAGILLPQEIQIALLSLNDQSFIIVQMVEV
jgi:hypothetical protein